MTMSSNLLFNFGFMGIPSFCSKTDCQIKSQFSGLAFKILLTLILPNSLLVLRLTSFFHTLNIYSPDCVPLSGVQVLFFFFSYSSESLFPLPRKSYRFLKVLNPTWLLLYYLYYLACLGSIINKPLICS